VSQREYKFSEALNFDLSFRGLAERIQNAELKKIAETYAINMERVRSLGMNPILFVRSAERLDTASTETSKLLIKFSDSFAQVFPNLTQEQIDLFYSIYPSDVANQMRDNLVKISEYIVNMREQLKQEESHDTNLGLGQPDSMVERILGYFNLADKQEFIYGIEATLTGMILGAWTAFEALCGDLWEQTINQHPRGLAELKGKETRINKLSCGNTDIDDSDVFSGIENEKQGRKLITLNDLQRISKGAYKFCDIMGTLLKRRYKFTKLSSIRTAYSAAFYERSNRYDLIDDALKDESLDALSLVRNLLVHKAGMADDEYVKGIASVKKAPSLTLRQTLSVDGKMVAELVDPVVVCCCKLITGVDTWMRCNTRT
jgi:hypothetical protein